MDAQPVHVRASREGAEACEPACAGGTASGWMVLCFRQTRLATSDARGLHTRQLLVCACASANASMVHSAAARSTLEYLSLGVPPMAPRDKALATSPRQQPEACFAPTHGPCLSIALAGLAYTRRESSEKTSELHITGSWWPGSRSRCACMRRAGRRSRLGPMAASSLRALSSIRETGARRTWSEMRPDQQLRGG